MITRSLSLLLAALLLHFSAASRADPANNLTPNNQPLLAGAASVDITPPAGWRLAGGFDDEPSSGTHDPLHARAVVLQQADTRIALVLCDLTGIPREFSRRAAELAASRSGIPADHIIIGATHTHGAPLFYDYRRDLFHSLALKKHNGTDPQEPTDYPADLADLIAQTVASAASSAKPASAFSTITPIENLAFNRRFHMKDGTVQFNPGKLNPDILRPAGPTDPDFHILLLYPQHSDIPLASLSLFAMHTATFGNGQFGADFPAHLENRLREALNPNLVSLFAEGCAGDVNHINTTNPKPQTSRDEPDRIGAILSNAFLNARPTLAKLEQPVLAIATRTIQVPLRPASPHDVAQARLLLDLHHDNHPASFLEITEAHRVIDVDSARNLHGDNLPMDVRAIRLDQKNAIVALPHEIFVELGLAIKKDSPFPNTFVLSLCDGVDFYVPTTRAYQEGSYEIVNSRVNPGAGERLVTTALELLNQLKTTAPN